MACYITLLCAPDSGKTVFTTLGVMFFESNQVGAFETEQLRPGFGLS